ncbi:MAG: ROK family protein [Anaerolineae bacterium]|nr:ROK family protein [Anaerolineae bacterium]
MTKKLLVGIDLGGTSLMAVVTTPKGEILGRKKVKTNAEEGANAVLGRIVDTAKAAAADAGVKLRDVRAIGVGFPGPLDPETGVVFHAPNLGPTWNNLALTDYLTEKLGPPAYLGNDVNVGAIGEHALGAGRGVRSLVSIFVGTGIGGGIILNGKLHFGARNTAGEVGHTVVLADGPLCGCGKRGCVEAMASRTAIERDIHAGLEAGRESLLPQIWQEMGRTDLSSSVLAAALARGDPLVTEVMQTSQYYMGLLVANLVNILEPEVIVFGGGLVEQLGDIYLDPVRETAEQYYLNQQDKDKIRVVASALKDYAGVLGAAIMANRAWKRAHKA